MQKAAAAQPTQSEHPSEQPYVHPSVQPPKYGALIRELTHAIEQLGQVWLLETVAPTDPHETNVALHGRLQMIEQRLTGALSPIVKRGDEIRVKVRAVETQLALAKQPIPLGGPDGTP